MKFDFFDSKQVMSYLQFVNKFRKKTGMGPKRARSVVDRSSVLIPFSEDVRSTRVEGKNFTYEILESETSSNQVLFYIHGGAFALGSVESHRSLIDYLIEQAGLRVISPEYPLSPENKYPSQLHAVEAALMSARERFPEKQWIVGGDSAGGNLSAVLAAKHPELFDGVVLLSPWLDLRKESPAIRKKQQDNSGFDSQDVDQYAAYYCTDEERCLAEVSPVLFEIPSNFPPTLIQVSDSELLYEDSIEFAGKLSEQGIACEIEVEEELFHSWQLFPSFSSKARNSLDRVVRFILGLQIKD